MIPHNCVVLVFVLVPSDVAALGIDRIGRRRVSLEDNRKAETEPDPVLPSTIHRETMINAVSRTTVDTEGGHR